MGGGLGEVCLLIRVLIPSSLLQNPTPVVVAVTTLGNQSSGKVGASGPVLAVETGFGSDGTRVMLAGAFDSLGGRPALSLGYWDGEGEVWEVEDTERVFRGGSGSDSGDAGGGAVDGGGSNGGGGGGGGGGDYGCVPLLGERIARAAGAARCDQVR